MNVRPTQSIVNHAGWKLLSLALATSIWLTIFQGVKGNLKLPRNAGVTLNTLTLHVPLEVRTAATDLRAYKVTPSTIEVKLGGDAQLLGDLKESDIEVFIDLKDRVPGGSSKRTVQVDPPAGVKLVNFLPGEVTVEPLPAVDSQNDHPIDSP